MDELNLEICLWVVAWRGARVASTLYGTNHPTRFHGTLLPTFCRKGLIATRWPGMRRRRPFRGERRRWAAHMGGKHLRTRLHGRLILREHVAGGLMTWQRTTISTSGTAPAGGWVTRRGMWGRTTLFIPRRRLLKLLWRRDCRALLTSQVRALMWQRLGPRMVAGWVGVKCSCGMKGGQ